MFCAPLWLQSYPVCPCQIQHTEAHLWYLSQDGTNRNALYHQSHVLTASQNLESIAEKRFHSCSCQRNLEFPRYKSDFHVIHRKTHYAPVQWKTNHHHLHYNKWTVNFHAPELNPCDCTQNSDRLHTKIQTDCTLKFRQTNRLQNLTRVTAHKIIILHYCLNDLTLSWHTKKQNLTLNSSDTTTELNTYTRKSWPARTYELTVGSPLSK